MKTYPCRIAFLSILTLAFLNAMFFRGGIDLVADAPNQDKGLPTGTVGGRPVSLLAGPAQISITAAGFDPAVLTVTVGTGVTWTNATGVTHVLQSGAPWRIFLPVVLKNRGGDGGLAGERAESIPRIAALDLPSSANNVSFSATLVPGETFTHTFTSSGDHPYFLATAPQFNGRVVVPSGDRSPAAVITTPRDGKWVTSGEPITFTGEATDPEDGSLSGASLVWTSNHDGHLGTGETFTAALTATGVHTITLTVTDSDGLAGAARIEVRALTPGITGGPPLLTVLADSDLDAIAGVAVNGAETLAYVTTDGGTELQRVDIDPDSPTFGQVTVVADTGLADLQMGIALNPADTCAYVLEGGAGELSRVDLSTGQVTLVASGLQNPHGLALDAAGSVAYVTEGDRLSRVVIATGVVSTVVSGLSSPHGVALSVDGTHAYVAESSGGRVSAVDLSSGAVTALATGLYQPTGVAVASDGTDAYVTAYDSDALSRVNLTSGGVTLVTGSLDGPYGLAVSSDESLAYVAEQNRGQLTAVYLGESPVTVIVPGESDLQNSAGIVLNSAGTLAYVAEEREGNGEISQVDLATGQVTTVVGGLNKPNDLALNQAETHLYAAGNIGQPVTLVAVELATSQVFTVSEALGGGLSGVALGTDGTLAYAVNFGSGELSVVDVDPTSPAFRQVTLIAGGLSQPRDVVLSPAGSLAYVTEQGAGELCVVDVDPASPGYGDITLVAAGLGGPRGLALSQSGDLVYLAEESGRELSVVDVDPGSAGYGTVTTILDQVTLRDVALSPDEARAFVTEMDDGVLVVDVDPGSPTFGSVVECLTPVPLDGARGLAVGGDDTIAYVVAEFSGKLSRVDIDPTSPAFGAVATVADDLFILNNITINQAETLAYVTREAGPGSPPAGQNVVTRVDLTTGAPLTVTDQLGQPTNIVLNGDETEGYVADRQQEGLYRVNLSTGAITPVVTGLANTFALAVNQAETLAYVTTSEFHPSSPPPGELLRVNLVTSQVVTVATGLVSPAGLWLNADETLAYVTEFGPEGKCGGALSTVDIDPASPTYGTVTRLLTGLCGPHDVQLNAAESVAYVVEVDGRRLIAID